MNLSNRYAARAAVALVGAVAVLAVLPAQAQGKDEQWEITSKMEIPGMPMAMPARVVQICVAKSAKDDEFIPKQGNCRMLEGKRTANKYTYKMECTGNEPATAEGEVTFGPGAYDGKMKMTMAKSNQAMQMTYSGKRTGDCTAPAK